MKLGLYLGTLLGIGLAIFLIATTDASKVLHVFTHIGAGMIPIVAIRGVIIAICSAGWAMLYAPPRGISFAVWPLLRWIREGVNVLLPVATVGGEIVGARLLTFWSVPAGVSGAGVLVDMLVQALGQAIFALLGVLLLTQIAGTETMTGWVLAGVGIAALVLMGIVILLRYDGAGHFERLVTAAMAKFSRDGAQRLLVNPLRLTEALSAIWARKSGVALSLALHIGAWLLGTLEIWIALYWTGHAVSFADALILESLGQAVRGAAFPVPGAIGVQEGGFVLLGHWLGIDPQTAIALSLVKRVPDIVLGLPALFAWHWLEGRRKHALPPPLLGRARLDGAN